MTVLKIIIALAPWYFLLSGCSISAFSHVSENQEPQQILNRSEPKAALHFFFYTGIKKMAKGAEGSLPIEFEVLRRELEVVGRPIMQEILSEKGIYIRSYKTAKFSSNTANFFCWFSAISLSLVPCYCESSGWNIVYTIYKNGESQRSYSYEISHKQFAWIGVIPFSWVNYLVPQYAEAFGETTRQFLVDTQKDGYWDD